MTDKQWLELSFPEHNDAELEFFIERVGMMIPDFFTYDQLEKARIMALHQLYAHILGV